MSTLSNLLRSRAVPVLATVALGSGIYWQTRGGRNQPQGRTEGKQFPISETLEEITGQGGKRARHRGDPEYEAGYVPGKDPRIMSHSPTSVKRSRVKVEDRDDV
ncbi:hypothetical protein QBC34DRAFT_306618 [Podospora aff. communis PSN243]|uniref:Uncharacterized protein n=1 Tax=Podospora aff. communis PSN243 TaxID=3040156 RepID=A0AAV9GDU8_9PEZI|nr:hypothetical protein QBC34DRAFT_306618 [Podospora aff. communis PSN243]